MGCCAPGEQSVIIPWHVFDRQVENLEILVAECMERMFRNRYSLKSFWEGWGDPRLFAEPEYGIWERHDLSYLACIAGIQFGSRPFVNIWMWPEENVQFGWGRSLNGAAWENGSSARVRAGIRLFIEQLWRDEWWGRKSIGAPALSVASSSFP